MIRCQSVLASGRPGDTSGFPSRAANKPSRVQDQKHNAAVQELQSVADRFNEQLRVWKARSEKEKKPS